QVLDRLGVLSVLPVDAAHAMNPHASQGRMQAMVDAMVLSDLLTGCLAEKDYSAAKLSAFERISGPHVTMLQQLADQQVFYWNTANQRWRFCATACFRRWIGMRGCGIKSYRLRRGCARLRPFMESIAGLPRDYSPISARTRNLHIQCHREKRQT
ncbi:MAG: hypothetical protein HOP22_16565, partial [Nitrospiraceae bacterium]|nr:hypothetical protein [Nitrospiraceae bacterium]